MIIKVDKKYIDASGDIVEIYRPFVMNFKLEYLGDNGSLYSKNGICKLPKVEYYDLICEVDECIYMQYTHFLITGKEFLNKHFELYGGMTLEQYNAKNQDN